MSRWNGYSDYDYGFPQYVTVAERKLQAQKKIKALTKKGENLSPIVIEGRKIAKTFWGNAWCDNIESYRDYESRLPRARSYVRSGAVIDLKIAKGKIIAKVMGSELYEIDISIKELSPKKWKKIKRECAGQIASLIDLINGKLSSEIIELLCRKNEGMFPAPKEIKMICNCPDWADLCKHLAAVMYAIGARLDKEPELFFLLRGVDQNELFSADITDALVDSTVPADIDEAALSGIFGIELDSLDDDIKIPKRKRGRPKKTTLATKASTSKKRKPGRPKKSKTIASVKAVSATRKKAATKPRKTKASSKTKARKKK